MIRSATKNSSNNRPSIPITTANGKRYAYAETERNVLSHVRQLSSDARAIDAASGRRFERNRRRLLHQRPQEDSCYAPLVNNK